MGSFDIGQIITQVIDNYNFAYMLSINILTYLIIKLLSGFNIIASTWGKRIVLIVVTIILAVVYYFTVDMPKEVLLNSTIAAPVFYSWVLKPLLDKFGIGYIKI